MPTGFNGRYIGKTFFLHTSQISFCSNVHAFKPPRSLYKEACYKVRWLYMIFCFSLFAVILTYLCTAV